MKVSVCLESKDIDPDSERKDLQECPVCGFWIRNQAGSKDAVCQNCGYKDPCCE